MVPHTSQETAWSATELSTGRKPWAARVVLLLSSVCMTVLALVGVAVTAPSSTGLVSLPQSVAPQVAAAHLTGATTGSQSLSLAISLHSRNQAGMQDYATQVAQPKSKLYHQYLTPAQFASAFGADPAALNNVEHYMQQQGLHLTAAQSGGLFLTFTGSVSQVESAFHTQINNYKAVDGRAVYANATALQVPSALAASITDVAGTENIRAVRSAAVAAPTQPKAVTAHVAVTCPTVTATNFTAAGAGYSFAGVLPAQIAKAYNMTGTNPGSGAWVALIEADGFSTADLAQFETCVNPALVSAVSATPGTSYSSSGLIQTRFPGLGSAITPGASAQAVEAEMETLLGLTPNLAHLTVVETTPTAMGTQLALADIANNNGPQVVGDQWGMCESDLGFPNAQAEEQLFMQMALQGESTFAATGNNGQYACNGDGKNFQNNGFGVMDPASDPFVTAVGGTQLNVAGNTATTTTWSNEQPWSNANLTTTGTYAAGGGGISQFWSAMPWQTSNDAAYTSTSDANLGDGATKALVGVKAIYNQGSVQGNAVAARAIPDVSAAADPVNSSVAIYCSVGSCVSGITTFSNVGGTNIANAIWVATAAQATQVAQTVVTTASAAGGRIGLAASPLYNLYGQDLGNAVAANKVITLNTLAYCDYPLTLGYTAAGPVNTPINVGVQPATFQYPDGSCGGTVLNQAKPILAAATSYTTLYPTAAGFQQPASATSIGGAQAGYAVKSNGSLLTLVAGYNAATGLGSPNVGVLTTNGTGGTGVNLAAYLANASRQALPRMYMVAQSTSANGSIPAGTYWIGAYGLNPYVQNMPTNTQWSALNGSQVFTGAPTIVDDANAGGNAAGSPKNLYIIGPTGTTSTTLAILKYNIATATTSVVTQNGVPVSPVPSGTTGCTSVSAVAANDGTEITIYCVASNNGLYANVFTIAGTTFGATAWSGPLLSNVTGQPSIAEQGYQSTSYMVVLQQSSSNNVLYSNTLTYNAGVTNQLKTTLTMNTLATTCNSTPAFAWIPQISSYAASCTAADTKNMWANVYSPTRGTFGSWQVLGQPSPSVTFMPGAAVAVDNVTNDPGYGLVFYVAEGSDKGMYLDAINTSTTGFLGKVSGWQSISLPGIFNSSSAADFANS